MAWSKKRIALVALLIVCAANSLLLVAILLGQRWLARPLFPAGAARSLIAYEPFDYPSDTLLEGQGGGHGFAGPWEPGGFNVARSDVIQINPGALTFSNLATTGANHLRIDAPPEGDASICGLARRLGSDLAAAGGTYYLSFLYRPLGEGGYGTLVLGTGQGRELSMGKSSSGAQFHLSQRGGTGRVFSDQEVIVGQTVFLVVKLEFRDGPDRFTLQVNPAPGQPEPAGGFVKEDLDLTAASHLMIYSRAAWSLDELRLGTSWAAVTPARH